MGTWGVATETVVPVEQEPDPARRAMLADQAAGARAEWEAACLALDIAEGPVRRGHTGDQAALHAARLHEQGTRERLAAARRLHEEAVVVEIVATATAELPALVDQVNAAGVAAAAALDDLAARLATFNAARLQVDRDLRAATSDPPTRLSLTGTERRYTRLPAVVADPLDHLTRAAVAARQRAQQR